jgi:hypothetical protein
MRERKEQEHNDARNELFGGVSEDFVHRCAIALLNARVPFVAEFRSAQTDVKIPVPFAFIGNSKRELRVVTLLADGRRHIELCAAPGRTAHRPDTEYQSP